MASVVEIVNSALNLLGASTITALSDDSKNARICNQRYEPIRNRIFRSHAWNCLQKRVELAQDTLAPVVEYSYAYTLPADCLRVLKLHTGALDSIEADIKYNIEGRKLLTNEATVYILYVALITDPNEYDTYLQEAIASQLASDICYAITNNATLAKYYQEQSDERLREARFIDATENSVTTLESNEFTDARL
jgi:hypothetical protein